MLSMKKQLLIPMFLIWGIVLAAPPLIDASSRIYHLGPVRVELMPLPQAGQNTIYFKLENTTGSPVRYFSVTCKIMKDGYLIDERICNGFGIAPNGSKEVQATFLWLPPVFDVVFEANKIRTENTVIAGAESASSLEKTTSLIDLDQPNESDDSSMDLVHNEYEIGRKYTIYDQGTWSSKKRSNDSR